LLVIIPHHRTIARRRHVDALHRGIAAGILATQLVPDIKPGRDVPHALQHPEQAILLRQVLRQVGRSAQTEDGVVVVDQRDLPVAHIDVIGHLDERRLRFRHHAERITHRASIAPHQIEEQLRRAGLITLQDCVGERIDRLVLPDVVSALQHGRSFTWSGTATGE